MKILIIEPAGNLWGSEKVLLDFLGALSDLPHQVGVCCPAGSRIIPRLEALPVQVFPQFASNLHLRGKAARLVMTAKLAMLVRDFCPDLVYVNQAGATRIALWASRWSGVPVVSHVRLVEDVEYVTSLKTNAKELPAVICVSRYIGSIFHRQGIFQKNKIHQLYDPYRTCNVEHALPEQERDCNGAVFACVGRIAYSKGQDLVLAALSHLKDKGIPTDCHFWGSAGTEQSYLESLKKLAAETNVMKHVFWRGYTEDVLRSIANCVALICPSRWEPLGRVIFEAWDAGLVPLAWRGSGGPAEVISSSGGGILFDHHDGVCLARAMEELMALPPQAQLEMIAKGRKWIRKHCDPEIFSRRMMDIFSAAVTNGKGSR